MFCLPARADDDCLDVLDVSFRQETEKTYDVDEDEYRRRMQALRTEIADAKLDWYLVPVTDEHQSEIEVSEGDKRLNYICGYNGEGVAVIPSSSLSTEAIMFTDSRYWAQAEQQLPRETWKVSRAGRDPLAAGGWGLWAAKGAEAGSRIGVDPRLIQATAAHNVLTSLASTSTRLIAVDSNLVDRTHTPVPRSLGPLLPYPLKLSGEDTPSKLARVRAAFSDRANSDSWIYVLPNLEAIAWLLNYRCTTDILYSPVAYAYLVLTSTRCVIFVDERKVQDEELRARWDTEGIEVRPYGVRDVGECVQELSHQDKQLRGEKTISHLWMRPDASWALSRECEPLRTEFISCPIDAIKAVKNPVEQQGLRNAYLRDGRAMVRWMAWLETKLLKEGRQLGEWVAVQTLTRYRRQEDMFAGLAYPDILASGPNGAMGHYFPQRGKDRIIDLEAPLVLDSGGQYLDGTIDTTRTMFLGKTPSDDVKRAYTRVLQGHIAFVSSTFPTGMGSDRLEMLAREFLYRDGLDYGHGTGHGVGSYLGVHEHPYGRDALLQPGVITTVEPGFYKEGEFGVRTESVYICKSVETKYEFGGKIWLGWDRITQVPIQTSLCDWSVMTKAEIQWLNDHNASVQETLMPLLQADQDGEARDWLKRACKPKKIWPWTGA